MRGVGRRWSACCIGLRPLVEGGVGSVCAFSCSALQPWNAEYIAEDFCLHGFDGFARLAAELKGCLPFPGVRETGGILLNGGFPFRFIADGSASQHLIDVDFAKREKLCTERSDGRVSCRAFFQEARFVPACWLRPLERAAATSGYSCSVRRSSAAPTSPANRGCGRVGRLLNSG